MIQFCKCLFLYGASICCLVDISKVQELVPVIMETYTDMSEKNNWIEVPKETKEITIYVKAKHTDTMLFWLVPTGTATWEERQLIGYDINGADGWSLKWNVSGKMLHHHICVQALGVTSISSDLINVHTEYK